MTPPLPRHSSVDALNRYGHHDHDCEQFDVYHHEVDCSCGFNVALRAALNGEERVPLRPSIFRQRFGAFHRSTMPDSQARQTRGTDQRSTDTRKEGQMTPREAIIHHLSCSGTPFVCDAARVADEVLSLPEIAGPLAVVSMTTQSLKQSDGGFDAYESYGSESDYRRQHTNDG